MTSRCGSVTIRGINSLLGIDHEQGAIAIFGDPDAPLVVHLDVHRCTLGLLPWTSRPTLDQRNELGRRQPLGIHAKADDAMARINKSYSDPEEGFTNLRDLSGKTAGFASQWLCLYDKRAKSAVAREIEKR